MLRDEGGSGTTNPFTGLDEYFTEAPEITNTVDVDSGPYAAGPNVGEEIAPDIGPDVPIGTHPLDTIPDVPLAPTAAPSSGFGGFLRDLGTNFAAKGPSLSRDGFAALPATVAMGLVPGGGLMRGAAAFAETLAGALGVPVSPGAPPSQNQGTGLGEPFEVYNQEPMPSLASFAAQQPTTASNSYKGLEPYMRDYLRRQGIFV